MVSNKQKFRDKYMHGYCQYFAIAVAEMFGGKVCLWLDKDYDAPDEEHSIRLCHAYAMLAEDFYVDVDGFFKHISIREDEFDFNEQNIAVLSIDEAKKLLRKLRIPYGDAETKREVISFLHNYLLCFSAGIYYSKEEVYGLDCVGRRRDFIGLVKYDVNKQTVGDLTVAPRTFATNRVIKSLGFLPAPSWYKHR